MFIKGYIEFNDKLLSSWVTKWAEIGCGWCWATKRAETGSGLCWTKWAKICKGLGQVVHVNLNLYHESQEIIAESKDMNYEYWTTDMILKMRIKDENNS